MNWFLFVGNFFVVLSTVQSVQTTTETIEVSSKTAAKVTWCTCTCYPLLYSYTKQNSTVVSNELGHTYYFNMTSIKPSDCKSKCLSRSPGELDLNKLIPRVDEASRKRRRNRTVYETIGQKMCETAGFDVTNQYWGLFYKNDKMFRPEFGQKTTKQQLCCTKLHYYKCKSKTVQEDESSGNNVHDSLDKLR